MRWLPLLLLLAGCFAAPQAPADGPPLTDRGQTPGDIEAPAPQEEFPDPELLEPPEPGEPYSIYGRVSDKNGNPILATLWVEVVDLRDPVNNVGPYEQAMRSSMRRTDLRGMYTLQLEGGFYHLRVTAPGFIPLRTEPILNDEGANRHDVTMVADTGPLILAHRGASFYAPENTLPALAKARHLGAHAAEIDVHVTSDGHVVLLHEANVERTTNGTGDARAMTWSQLSNLDAGAWFDPSFTGTPMPRLQDAIDGAASSALRIIVDIKGPSTETQRVWNAVAAVVAATGAADRTVLASFQSGHVTACAADGRFTCAWIVSSGTDIVARAGRLGAEQVLLRQDLVSSTLQRDARLAGISIHAWTANDPAEWDALLDLGVDGILTDHPGFLQEHISERRLREAATP